MPPRKTPSKFVLVVGYILAVILGIWLAYLFLRFLSSRIDFTHLSDAQRLLMVLGSIVFGILAYYSLRSGLSKCRNAECKEHDSSHERSDCPPPRTLCQVHKTVVAKDTCNDKEKHSEKYPTCTRKKTFHLKKSISQESKRSQYL